jgi:hypothetical protein
MAYLLRFMEPGDLLRALLHLAKLRNLPIDEDEFRALLDIGDDTADADYCSL